MNTSWEKLCLKIKISAFKYKMQLNWTHRLWLVCIKEWQFFFSVLWSAFWKSICIKRCRDERIWVAARRRTFFFLLIAIDILNWPMKQKHANERSQWDFNILFKKCQLLLNFTTSILTINIVTDDNLSLRNAHDDQQHSNDTSITAWTPAYQHVTAKPILLCWESVNIPLLIASWITGSYQRVIQSTVFITILQSDATYSTH